MTNSNIVSLIKKRRTIRLFSSQKVPYRIVKTSIDCARLAPSAANLQFIEYLVIDRKDLKRKIFPCLKWAGYIYPLRTPSSDEQPYGYILILINKKKSASPDLRDIGAAVENIILVLFSFGIGSCWLANIDRDRLENIFNIPDFMEIDSILAYGYPKEFPMLETRSDEVKYWLDNNNCLHVPKRPLKDVLHHNKIFVR